jgi:hypothetical protein
MPRVGILGGQKNRRILPSDAWLLSSIDLARFVRAHSLRSTVSTGEFPRSELFRRAEVQQAAAGQMAKLGGGDAERASRLNQEAVELQPILIVTEAFKNMAVNEAACGLGFSRVDMCPSEG